MVGGYSRFQYDGFWFGFLQPLPPGWGWDDDFYIVYQNDGYYLCDPLYPGVEVAITLVG